MQQDILADALSAVKNARNTGKGECTISPTSGLIKDVLKVLQDKGYIGVFEEIEDGKGGKFKVEVKNRLNECNAVKPRFYVDKDEYRKYEERHLPARDFGELIVTTPEGVMDHREARERGVGGALLAYVY
ncbi:MAG: 30S ribosomal protein S8 [Candidatus Nanohaloarchaeota archaeon QJJ-7]|nr:30S ribosomal protein S8 [Candidatus Nanohaloarchaeota archaeon QJJ-7]